jgi:hypothetical protein
MKLQLVGNYHSPVLSGKGGDIFPDVDERVGQGLIDAGYAVRLDALPEDSKNTVEEMPDVGPADEVTPSSAPMVRRPLKMPPKK